MRQGDPLSPYLFVLAMEVLTRLMRSKVRESQLFQFYPHCARQQITHLSFADDLLIFVVVDVQSIQIIKDALENHQGLSYLPAQLTNQRVKFLCCYSCWSPSSNSLHSPVRSGSFPVRYLGKPLIAGKLSFADCVPLIENITATISVWIVRHLSFLGRLQLIQSVLNSIQIF